MLNVANLGPPQFLPQQHVRIRHLGCRTDGRVTCVQLDRGGWSYEVEAHIDGDFWRRWFLPDELEASPS